MTHRVPREKIEELASEEEDFDTEVLNLARKAAKKWQITLDRLRDFELEEKEENKEIG